MLENYTNAELHNLERRCLDLLIHENEVERANARLIIANIRHELDRRTWLRAHASPQRERPRLRLRRSL